MFLPSSNYKNELESMLSKLFKKEIKSSRKLESIVFDKQETKIFRYNIDAI